MVFHAPCDVYLVKEGQDYKEARNIVQPDLSVICDQSKMKCLGIVGAPDLLVEILSSSTARKDINDKFGLYREYGVKEYWIVHPLDGTVVVNVLENGVYKTLKLRAKGEMLRSAIFPDLNIDLDAVFNNVEFSD